MNLLDNEKLSKILKTIVLNEKGEPSRCSPM